MEIQPGMADAEQHSVMSTAAASLVTYQSCCIHCGNTIDKALDSPFCCSGCEAVYAFLHEKGFDFFYDLKEKGSPLRKASPVSLPSESFSYLDDPEFLVLYSWAEEDNSQQRLMEFYLQGVHCAACIWLTENVNRLVPEVLNCRLNLGNSRVTVKIDSSGKFSSVAQAFSKMGYRPHPIQRNQHNPMLQKENRLLLIRIGVAATCAGNIMLLAISLYGGATGTLAVLFQWMSFILFLPVLLFCAVPFYQSAWIAIKQRQASVDIPIVIGTSLATTASVINLLRGSQHTYFDSISAIIFLLLSTRLLLKRVQQSSWSASQLIQFMVPSAVRFKNLKTQQFESVRMDQLKPNDTIQVLAGESVPVDGIVIHGNSTLNRALLTGESNPEEVGPGTAVYAGTVNLQAPLELRVVQLGSATRLGKILRNMEESLLKKASLISFSDQVSRIFVWVAGILSFTAFAVYAPHNLESALERAIAIALVTCPCVFAFATPLVFSISIGKLAKNGILIKGSETLEKLSQVKNVFLDKTGTLTIGRPELLDWRILSTQIPQEEIEAAIYALESQSNHPIARAWVRFLKNSKESHSLLLTAVNIREKLGFGISGDYKNRSYKIERARNSTHQSQVEVWCDEEVVGIATFGDPVCSDATHSVQALRKLGMIPHILSGDSLSAVHSVAQQLEIPLEQVYAEQSPEDKNRKVIEFSGQRSRTLMVGDGANDAVALASADVGVAVRSGVEISLRAADVYLSTPGLNSLIQLIVVARESIRVIKRNFIVSIFYNAAAIYGAMTGQITPLFAALLMPISALLIFSSSIIGTKKLRTAYSGIKI